MNTTALFEYEVGFGTGAKSCFYVYEIGRGKDVLFINANHTENKYHPHIRLKKGGGDII